MSLEKLKQAGEAPEWLTDEGLKTLYGGYLGEGETPRLMWKRVARTAAMHLNRYDLEPRFFDAMWSNWLCLASPVATNMGSSKGLPISCNSSSVGDSLQNIMEKATELAILSKHGAGMGMYLGNLRARGAIVQGTGGFSDGPMAWAKIFDSTVHSVSQGGFRRGSAAVYMPENHPDIYDFLDMRRPTGDLAKRCLNLHHGVSFGDEFMHDLIAGNKVNRKLWHHFLTARIETGEPYALFRDHANNQKPQWFKDQNLMIETSNLCNEIMLPTDPQHTFVCCLLSLNVARWDEWKNTDVVELAAYLLDAVITEYITKAKNIPGFESAVRFAEKSRALGIGVLGWHSLLQSRMIAFDSFEAMMLNSQIFRKMRADAERASERMAIEYGEPLWLVGYGRRNATLIAVAPTVSNSTISGGKSAGIEPEAANVYVQKSAKGTFIRKNQELVKLLQSKNLDNEDTWSTINKDSGSVLNLKGLSDEEKEVFKTAREINQFAIIKQAAQRQKWIDQGQSVNLFFASNSDPKYIHQVHLAAWEEGLKGLYYCRPEARIRADLASRGKDECAACEA